MPVNEDPPSRSASATLLYWAASALRLHGLIKVTLCSVVHSTVAQCLALRTAKDIFDLVVLKLVTSEVPMRLVLGSVVNLTISDRNCPKNTYFAFKCLQQPLDFRNRSFSSPGVLACESYLAALARHRLLHDHALYLPGS